MSGKRAYEPFQGSNTGALQIVDVLTASVRLRIGERLIRDEKQDSR